MGGEGQRLIYLVWITNGWNGYFDYATVDEMAVLRGNGYIVRAVRKVHERL